MFCVLSNCVLPFDSILHLEIRDLESCETCQVVITCIPCFLPPFIDCSARQRAFEC